MLPFRHILASTLVAVLTIYSSSLYADWVNGDIVETSHRVQLKRKGDFLYLNVTRVFKNIGTGKSTELQLQFLTPQHSTISTLSVNFNGKSIEGKIENARKARKQYYGHRRAKINRTSPPERGAALLTKESQDNQFSLAVFPLKKNGTVKVSYTIQTRPELKGGKWRLFYPKAMQLGTFSNPEFSYSKPWYLNNRRIKSQQVAAIGYDLDPRCRDLDLPKHCRIVEILSRVKTTHPISFDFSLKRQAGFNAAKPSILLLGPKGESIPLENCMRIRDRVACRTKVLATPGKWKLIFDAKPSPKEIQTHLRLGEKVIDSTVHPGHARIEIDNPESGNRIRLGLRAKGKRQDGELEIAIHRFSTL